MPLKFRYPAPWILLVLAWLVLLPAVSAQDNTAYIVTNVDKTRFPTVQVNFRALDLDTIQVLPNLNNKTVTVYENGQPVRDQQLIRRVDDPVNIIFMIDLGAASNYAEFGLSSLREAILALVREGYFIDGKDTVQVLGRENINSDQTVPLLEPTQDGSALIDWANQFDFLSRSHSSKHPTKGLQGVKEAMDVAAKGVPLPGSQTTAIIFITHAIEDPVPASAEQIAQSLAQEARQRRISIFTFQTMMDTNDKKFNPPLTILSAGTTDGYTPLYNGTKVAAVNAVYQVINSQRVAYSVTYHSQTNTAGGVQITINSPLARDIDRPGSYEISANEISSTAPGVAIVQPAQDSTIRLKSSFASDGQTWVTESKQVSVVAEITWPEGVPHRPFQSAELLVKGVPLQSEGEWNSDLTRLTFAWDLTATQQTQAKIPLTVRLSDASGEMIQAETMLNVVVSPPPDRSCPEGSLFCGTGLTWLLVGSGGVLFLTVSGVSIYFWRRKPARKSRDRKSVKNIFTDQASGEPIGLATLNLLEGAADMRGKKYELTQTVTVLGRNPAEADIVFDQNPKSSVSRMHCTIKVDGNRYLLSDLNSSNGTWVNGRRLFRDETMPLHNGDVVILGELSRAGVKFRFHLQPRKNAEEEDD